jgi:hypothetical protein
MKVQSENELQRVVSEGNEKQLTKELIVASLRQQGITDLDTFAERSLQAWKASEAVPLEQLHPASAHGRHEDAIVELLFGDAAQKAAKKSPYAEPRLPFRLREKAYKPSEIRQFEGKAIHFVWDENALASGLLRAVDDPDEMRSLLGGRTEAGSGADALSHVPGAPHVFYQHINFGGASVSLAYRHAYPDLTRVTLRAGGSGP